MKVTVKFTPYMRELTKTDQSVIDLDENAHLDPYLGYLHSIQFAKPSLVCDIQEIFRALIEDFLITYHQNLEPESFEQKAKRIFLKPNEKLKLILELNRLLKKKVPYKRRNFSKTTMIRTIIKEEPIKLAQYLRGNKMIFEPTLL